VIIGETAVVGNNVTLYQGVTLGGTGKEHGKRHPTIGDNVMISAGAKIIGSFKVGENSKIGAGSVPIETDEGWLLIYHGVINTCNGFVYRMGCALLDLEEPWKVIRRTKNYILGPHEIYECVGDVPNVVFPCAALADAATGRIAIYYGCADTVTGLAFTTADRLMAYMDPV